MTTPQPLNQLPIDPAYARVAAVSPPGTPTFPPTHQPPQQGQPAYFQQYGQPFQSYPQNQQQQQQQHFTQYQQQQFQQQAFFAPPNQQAHVPQYVANAVKAWVYTKLALHAIDIVLCICAIALSFSLGAHGTVGYAYLVCTPVVCHSASSPQLPTPPH